ncbi:MAG: efflux RND transporter periplasmic adaptor subunit [Marinoscillum sp.]|uniref:efflux RND transporter periplasmic adaptor subunit n=1 Tax=Marinoscillum sp. TaxID=2024838 RepID=UPI0032F5EBC0
MKKLLQNKYALIGLTLVIGALIGWVLKPSAPASEMSENHEHVADENGIWTCSMHPQIRQNEPGSCPICGMDLIPLEADMGMEDPLAITMSPTALKLANVVTQKVASGEITRTIRLNGKVMENEKLVYTQASHIPGRVETLNVNFSGEFVQKGQVIAAIYSPELVTAQQELFEAQKIKDRQPELFAAAKRKLYNWKLTEAQINQILANGTPLETLPIRSERSGYVKEKLVMLGDYIKQGAPIYMIADLSNVWVLFDAYESDMAWVREGAPVSFTISSLPGEEFTGNITYIDPTIDPKTRVSKLRVEVNNPDYQLKPEMFASGVLSVAGQARKEGLIVPKTAVMWTGKRSVVYVKTASDQGISFRMRMVTLGPSLGDSYVVKEGLEAGEEIVVNGTFSVDAAAQLAGKPSMMSPRMANSEGGVTSHNHGGETHIASGQQTDHPEINTSGRVYDADKTFQNQIRSAFESYLPVKDALVASDPAQASVTASALLQSLEKVDMKLVKGEAHTEWMKDLAVLKSVTSAIQKGNNLETMRMMLSPLSDQLYHTIRKFNVETSGFRLFCPMVMNNKGAFWLSGSDKIGNPYFGDAMLTCGNVEEKLK